MTIVGWSQIVFFSLILLACTKPLGLYMHKVMEEQPSIGGKFIQPIETFIYRMCGVTPEYEMRWTEYAFCAIAVSAASSLFTYAILRLQGFLPLNPVHFSTDNAPSWATNMSPDLAFNTAVSFATNTNWQAYSGENTMSYLSQMLGLAFHNWLSAATGIAIAIAMVRGFSRHSTETIGNFWKDLVRIHLYILLPLCAVGALFLVSQGCIQTLHNYCEATTIEGVNRTFPWDRSLPRK